MIRFLLLETPIFSPMRLQHLICIRCYLIKHPRSLILILLLQLYFRKIMELFSSSSRKYCSMELASFCLYFKIPQIQLPNFPTLNQTIHNCRSNSGLSCDQIQVLGGIFYNLYNHLQDQARINNQIINTLSDPMTPASVRRIHKHRALSFISTIQKKLFGVSTKSEVRHCFATSSLSTILLWKVIWILPISTHTFPVLLIINNQRFSILNARVTQTFHGFTDVVCTLSDLHSYQKTLDFTVDDLSTQINTLFCVTSHYLANCVANLQTLQELLVFQKQFFHSIKILHIGQLSPFLVHPKQLKQALHLVRCTLITAHPGYSMVHNDISYYSNGHFLSVFTYIISHLHVSITVPVSPTISQYQLLSVITFPVPVQASIACASRYTQLTNVSSILAVTPGHNAHIELSTDIYNTCTIDQIVQCPLPLFAIQGPFLTCTAVLFFDHMDKIPKLRTFKFLP